MKRVKQRELRLRSEGFPYWEARQLSEATQYRLDDPAMKELRSLRRREWRSHSKAGLGKRSYNRRVAFYYESEGLKDRDKFQVVKNVQGIRRTPQIAKRVKLLRIQRETPAGYDGRYKILRDAKFFPWEARLLARMEDINPTLRRATFLSKPWQAMIKNHKAFVDKMLIKAAVRVRKEMGRAAYNLLSNAQKKRLAQQRLDKLLRNAYAASKYSPYEWLRREYRPKARPRIYQTTQRKRAKKRTDRFLPTKKQQQQKILFFD